MCKSRPAKCMSNAVGLRGLTQHFSYTNNCVKAETNRNLAA